MHSPQITGISTAASENCRSDSRSRFFRATADARRRLPTWLLCGLVAVAMSACGGCGDEGAEQRDTGVDAQVEDVGAEVGDDVTGEPDTNGEDASDAVDRDTADVDDGLRRYDPSLADLGAPSTHCDTELVSNPDQPGAVTARFFVPSFRLAMADAVSHRTFRERIHTFIFEHVLPCVVEGVDNVVIFPESMVLPMLVLGDKAITARTQSTSEAAIASMLPRVLTAYQYYGQQFADLPIANQLLLSLTDPVVRATWDTFGQIADRYDLYISVTIDLPEFEQTTDPELITKVGDPDFDELDYAYVATDWKVKNVQLLFGPDGELVGKTEKTYVTLTELGVLNLSPGDFLLERPMQTPWGRTGVVISKPAWMPDVQDRLDDLGTELIFQPEAYSGGWIIAQENPARWEPDNFMLGGWNMVQRGSRAMVNAVPQLTGNFFDLAIDSQVQIIEKTSRQAGAGQFVGQRGPLPGNTFIAPWVVEDDEAGTLDDRRAALLDVGLRLLPGSGDPLEGAYIEGVWAYDLALYEGGDSREVQTHPTSVRHGEEIRLISSAGVVGERVLRVDLIDGLDFDGEAQTHGVQGYDLIRPQAVAAGDQIHVVAELVGEGENPLYYVRFDTTSNTFQAGAILTEGGAWGFHPHLVVDGDDLHLTWIMRLDDANRAHYMRGNATADSPFADSEPVAIEARPSGRPELRANQWDARIAVNSSGLMVTWIDFRNWQWEVMASASTDGGQSWSPSQRVDTVEAGIEALHATPTIISTGSDTFMLAWGDLRASRPNGKVALRAMEIDGEGRPTALALPFYLDEGGFYDQWSWRPSLSLTHSGRVVVVHEALQEGARYLGVSWLTEDHDAVAERQTLMTDSGITPHFGAMVEDAEHSMARAFFEEVGAFSASSSVRIVAVAPD